MRKTLLILAWTLAAGPAFAITGEFMTGYGILSYDSNFTAHGSEHTIPFILRAGGLDGRLRFNAGGSYIRGDYHQDGVEAVGLAAHAYSANGLCDATAGGSFEAPIGSFTSVLAFQANLPTGDERWELDQLTDRQTPGNPPLSFFPSRYRGRGFGVSGLAGLGREVSGWEFGVAGGYLRSGTVDVGAVESPVEYDPGDCLVGVATVSKKLSSGRVRFKASESFPQASRVDGRDAFTSPSSTAFEVRFNTFGKDRFAVSFSCTLYGRGKVADAAGNLVDEGNRSLGTRIEVKPSYQYALGDRWRLETRARWKQVGTNGYPEDDLRFEGGGNLVGLGQGFRLATGRGTFLSLDAAFDHLLHEKAARNAEYRLTAVTYNVVVLKTGVGVSW